MVVSIISKYQLWGKRNERNNTVKEHSQVILKEHSRVILKEHSQVILSYPDNMTKMYGKKKGILSSLFSSITENLSW